MSTDQTEPQTIAITATFTAEPLERPLAFWMQELDVPVRIAFAPYNQVFQELLNPSSLLAGNRNGINVVLVRLEDWQQVERNARDLVQALIGALGRSPTFHLLFLCPPSPLRTSNQDRALFQQAEDFIASGLAGVNGVHVVPTAELEAAYPVANPHNPSGDELAHIPYTPVYFTALATMLARKIHALRTARPKVLIVDADQTLWGGLCGEDGHLGVQIDPVRQAIQEFLVGQHDAGLLLCLCSKNNEEDVVQVFEHRPEMRLRRDHLVAWRVNWRPKSENIRSLARELQLSLDSVIFLDDDPVECAEVQANCPEVLTLPLPPDPEQIRKFLGNLWCFDRLQVTGESRERTALYQRELQRRQFQAASPTLKDFLAGLGLMVRMSAPSPHQLARAAELTQRTNQFNLTGVRRSEAEIQHLCQHGQAECLVVQASDRFGDYGLVGVILFRVGAGVLVVDTLLLSCRTLGRGVEHRMLARLGQIARERSLDRVDVHCVRTGKNQPALDFLDRAGGPFREPLDDGFLFRLPTEVAASVRYQPPAAEPAHNESTAQSQLGSQGTGGPVPDTRARSALLRSIAEELADVEQIHALVVSARARPEITTPFVAPRTAIEKKLAAMYAELLAVEQVGVHDNFFDLGGHSLLATQVLARMRDAFGMEFSPRLFLTGTFTVAELAKTVATKQVQLADPQDVAAVLKQLDQLSDDEVRSLLSGPEDAGRPPAPSE